jgi:hypothetical protein
LVIRKGYTKDKLVEVIKLKISEIKLQITSKFNPLLEKIKNFKK